MHGVGWGGVSPELITYTLPKPSSMSPRLRLGEFLSSPACTIYVDRDIPEAENETFIIWPGIRTDIWYKIIQNFRSGIVVWTKNIDHKNYFR